MWFESEVTLYSGCVSKGGWNVTWLHWDELLVTLEVVVCGKDFGTYEFFLEDCHEVKKVLGVAVADVVDFVSSRL